jgi:hypothetical protein
MSDKRADEAAAQPAIDPCGPAVGAASYYVTPLVWIGEAPDNINVSVAPGQLPPDVDLGQLADVVVETSLPEGLRARAHRDGLITFDFSKWAPRRARPLNEAGFVELTQLALRRVGLMNAHVACLHTTVMRDQHFALPVVAMTPGTVLTLSDYDDPESSVGFSGPQSSNIYMARYVSSYSRQYADN